MSKEVKEKWYAPHHSAEELYFSWWLDDLESRGMIVGREVQPQAFNLAPPVTFEMVVPLKTKDDRTETKTLEQGHIYTPDAFVSFAPAMGSLLNIVGEPTTKEKREMPWCVDRGDRLACWIEIKPFGYDPHNMLRLAKINQKWVWDKFGTMVNIFRIGNAKKTFFDLTFTPERYLKCDRATERDRKISFSVRSVGDFLE